MAATRCSIHGAPGRSTLSYEKYFGENKGYVSAAAFYKDLTSYIYDQTTDDYDFSDLLATTPPGYFPPGVTPLRDRHLQATRQWRGRLPVGPGDFVVGTV